LKILMAGSHGLVGSALSRHFDQANHEVVSWRVPRPDKPRAGEEAAWQFIGQNFDSTPFYSGCEAFLFFAGASINQRWTPAAKRAIEFSRTYPSSWMAEQAARSTTPPRLIISASAMGYYGDRGEEILTEKSPPGLGFLSKTVERWESAWQPAIRAGIPVILLRLGIVISPRGGAMKSMLPIFKLGLGGPIAGGRQWISWIHLDDVVRIVDYYITFAALPTGAVNAVSPNPIRNAEFTKALAKALHRPAVIPVPGQAIKTLFGEMGTTALLSSTRVIPETLQKTGFLYARPTIEKAFEDRTK
jgi:uncharacterized protein (TIGR01777 family)